MPRSAGIKEKVANPAGRFGQIIPAGRSAVSNFNPRRISSPASITGMPDSPSIQVKDAPSPVSASAMGQELGAISATPKAMAQSVQQRIQRFLSEQGMPSDTPYVVGSGAATSLYGLRPGQPIRDVDIWVRRALPKGRQNIDVGGVDAWVPDMDPNLVRQAFDRPTYVHGVPVMSPKTLLGFKQSLNRPMTTAKGFRDAQDIQGIQDLLSESKYKYSSRKEKRNPVDQEEPILLADETGRPVPAAQASVTTKEKSAADGHWRRLEAGEKGKGPGGEAQVGRTWVHRNNLSSDVIPKPHQLDFEKAIRNMSNQGGIIAAHGTGTGKTLTAVNAFEKLKGEGRAKRALVITPSGLRTNFLEKGVQKFTKSKGVILDTPRELPEADEYAIVSYDAFRRRPQEFIDKLKPDTLIADEVHRAANPESKNYQSLMLARQQVPRFMGLTASVVQNDPREVIPLLKLTTGGKTEIGSEGNFRRMYVSRTPSAQRGIFGGRTYEENLIRTAMLKSKIGGTVHYVEDLDASEKPAEIDNLVEVPMSKEQIGLYHMSMQGIDPVIVNKIKQGLPVDKPKELKMIFTRLLRARQAANSLNVVTPGMSAETAAEKTPKIKKILDDAADHLKKTPDGQVVLYTNFVHGGVDVLEAGLKKRGIPFGIFAGQGVPGVNEETRQQAVRDYLAGKNRAIIITGAGAEGLSLGNTTMVQLVDGHYNPERINQAKARGIRAGGLAHRPPEQRKVMVKRYVSTLPKTFWQRVTFQPAEKSTDQFVYSVADRKSRLNRQLRDVLSDRAAYEKKRRDSTLFRWFGGGP